MAFALPFPYVSNYTDSGTPPVNYQKTLTITSEYLCDENESYRTNLIATGSSQGTNWQGRLYQEEVTTISVADGGTPTGRYAFIIPAASDNRYCQLSGDVRGTGQDGYLQVNYKYRYTTHTITGWDDFPEEWTEETLPSSIFPEITGSYDAGGLYADDGGNTIATFSTNVPIFKYEDLAKANQYVYTSDDALALSLLEAYCINFRDSHYELPHWDFELINGWEKGTWTVSGSSNITEHGYRNVRAKVANGGKIALYDIPGISDGALKYGVKMSAYCFDITKSLDGVNWETANEFPFEYFFRKRENELGTFKYAITNINNTIPKFSSEEDAIDYIHGEKDISEADNWEDIADNWPGGNHPAGTPDANTEMGTVTFSNIFSQQYVLPVATLSEIATNYFDTSNGGMWDDIKKGLAAYGDSPIESVQNLAFYPVDMTSVYGTSPQTYIYFGGFKMDLVGTCSKVINQDGHIDCGSLAFTRINNNWMDYEPYTKCYIHLPYCGDYQLNLSELYGKTLSVEYYVDSRSNGSCLACLFVTDSTGKHLIEKYNGQMAVTMPITMTDFSAYANAQIQTLLSFGGQAMSTGGNIAGAATSGLASGGAAAASGVASAGLGVAAIGGVMGARTVYGLAQNNINKFNKTKGGSTSMLNMYMPQYVYFTFERNIPDIPSNFYTMNGYPSNKGGSIGSFSGFLKCDTVKLKMTGATDAEKERARMLLLSGVFL